MLAEARYTFAESLGPLLSILDCDYQTDEDDDSVDDFGVGDASVSGSESLPRSVACWANQIPRTEVEEPFRV